MVSKKNNKSKSNYTIFIIIIIVIIINFKNDILNFLNLDTNLFNNITNNLINMLNNLFNTLLNILGVKNTNSNTSIISNINNNVKVNKNKVNNDKNNISIKKIINEVKKEENKENIDPAKAVKLGEIHQYGLYDHNVNTKIAIDYYLYALNNGHIADASYNLAKLYYEGCQDIKPDAMLCIDYCLKGLQSGNFNCLLLLGTLYHRGIHPYYQPNRIAAKEIFEFIINNSETNKNISKELVNSTHERLIEINKEDNQEHTYNSLSDSNANIESFDDNEGGFLPGDILFQVQNFMPKDNPMNYNAAQKYIGGKNRQNIINESNDTLNNITNIVNNAFNNTINNQNLNTNDFHNVSINNYNNNNAFNIFDTNENANNMYQEALLQDILNTRNNNDNNDNNNNNNNRARNNANGDLLDIWINNNDINNDSQNVHDHNLLDYAVKSINNLKKLDTNFKNYDINELRNNLINTINDSSISANEKKNATNVVSRILNNNRNEHSRLKISEADLLNLVVNRIKKHNNSTDLYNNLIQNLTSGVEKGFVVCGTGRMMRMLGALDNLDKDNLVELKPSWALKEEISNTINKIRDTELSKCPNNVKNQYDSGEDSEEVNNLLNSIKEKVKEKCSHDYVKNGILSESELTLKLEPLLNGL